LVDGDDDRGRPLRFAARRPPSGCRGNQLGQHRLQRRGANPRRRAQLGARLGGQRRGERGDQPMLAAERRPLGPDRRQDDEMRVVAREPRQKPGAQE
jgi:hypothetical protein